MIIQFALHHLIKLNSQCRTLDTKARCVSPFDYLTKWMYLLFFLGSKCAHVCVCSVGSWVLPLSLRPVSQPESKRV
jgi:hypothetical protein